MVTRQLRSQTKTANEYELCTSMSFTAFSFTEWPLFIVQKAAVSRRNLLHFFLHSIALHRIHKHLRSALLRISSLFLFHSVLS
jgi:hypothetical protein